MLLSASLVLVLLSADPHLPSDVPIAAAPAPAASASRSAHLLDEAPLTTPAPAARPEATAQRLAGVTWALLQLPRLIAVPLILDVMAGREDKAWLFPAIVDVVVAAAAPFVAAGTWWGRGLPVWVSMVVFLAVSIFDHGDAVTASLVSPTPRVFGGPAPAVPSWSVPTVQAGIDVGFLLLWATEEVRAHYLGP